MVESADKPLLKEKPKLEVAVESSTKQEVKERVKLEVECESADKVLIKEKVRLEAAQRLTNMFPEYESGRSDDDSKKRKTHFEGIRCAQLESLKSLVQKNTWLLSTFAFGNKQDVGFVTVVKGHTALINFHYFQILKTYFKDIEDHERRLIFTQPDMEGGHEATLKSVLHSAKPLMRGEIQTEFYTFKMPATIHLGRDITS